MAFRRPIIKYWPGNFVIFHVIRTSIAKSGPPVTPLDYTCVICCSRDWPSNIMGKSFITDSESHRKRPVQISTETDHGDDDFDLGNLEIDSISAHLVEHLDDGNGMYKANLTSI